MTRRIRVVLSIAVIAALIGFAPLFTLQSKAAIIKLKVRGGPLGFILEQQPKLAPIDITGIDRESSGTLGLIDARDARGTGAGWSLVVQATDLVARDDSSHTIPAAGLYVSQTAPVVTIAGNAAPKSFSGVLSTPLELLRAGANTGMGHFRIEPPIALAVPADVFAGTYDSTLTLTLISGP